MKSNAQNHKLIQTILMFDGLLFLCGGVYLFLTPEITAKYLGFDQSFNMIFSGTLAFTGLTTALISKIKFGTKDETK